MFLMDNIKTQAVEELLRRIHELEYGHAQLKLKIMNLVKHHQKKTSSSSQYCPRGVGVTWHSGVNLTEANYFNILQSIDEPIHLTDANACIVYGNPGWEKFYGYTSAESIGKNVLDLLVKPKEARIAKNIIERILQGESHCGEFITRNHKGERFLSIVSSKPLRDDNGIVIGIIVISTFPRPYQEIVPEPIVGSPKKLDFDPQKTVIPPKILSAKAEWMVKGGVVWPWKGNERKGGHFDSRTAPRLCLHWLQSDHQENEYVEQKSCGISAKVENHLASYLDKLYEINWEDLKVKQLIRRGSSGRVFQAVWYGSDVAVKLLSKQEYSHDSILSFRREVSIMKKLRHPNILLFMGTVISPHRLCIVTEFLPRGSLFQLLHQHRARLEWKHRVHMAIDIARGMSYLHHCNPPIVHCDLKSPNLLVDKNWRVKIGDFGQCRIKHNSYVTTKQGTGTPQWMAPEVIRDGHADEKSDVYSFGVVLWEFTTEKVPWEGLDSIQVMKAVGLMNQRLDIPKHVDPQWTSLIQRCFCSEPESRPTFQEILDELNALQKKFVDQVEE